MASYNTKMKKLIPIFLIINFLAIKAFALIHYPKSTADCLLAKEYKWALNAAQDGKITHWGGSLNYYGCILTAMAQIACGEFQNAKKTLIITNENFSQGLKGQEPWLEEINAARKDFLKSLDTFLNTDKLSKEEKAELKALVRKTMM